MNKAGFGSPDPVYRTQPYSFFYSNENGVTLSTAWEPEKTGGRKWVIGFDVLTKDIFDFVSSMGSELNGKAFLFDEHGILVDTLQHEGTITGEKRKSTYLTPLSKPEDSVVSKALQLMISRETVSPGSFGPIEFMNAGKRWWTGFRPLPKFKSGLWIGIVVPASDFTGNVRRRLIQTGSIIALVLAAGILLAIHLVRKHSRKIREISQEGYAQEESIEQQILSLIQQGESNKLEFKSTMRMNLKTEKSGKEIEFAWLKTLTAFLNSSGGVLLIGIGDNGNILGIEADGFEVMTSVASTLKNLIQHHIGPEYSRYIHFSVETINQKKVAFIKVDKSDNPAFFRTRKEEHFYIRSGPSNVKLSVSKVLEYLKNSE